MLFKELHDYRGIVTRIQVKYLWVYHQGDIEECYKCCDICCGDSENRVTLLASKNIQGR